MNRYTVQAVSNLGFAAVIVAAIIVAPKVLHLWNQKKLMEKAMFIPVEASYEERREQRGDYL